MLAEAPPGTGAQIPFAGNHLNPVFATAIKSNHMLCALRYLVFLFNPSRLCVVFLRDLHGSYRYKCTDAPAVGSKIQTPTGCLDIRTASPDDGKGRCMVLQLGNFGHLSKEPAVSGEVAGIWEALCSEAVEASARDPALVRAMNSAVLYHTSFTQALAHRIALKLANHDLDQEELLSIIGQAFLNDHSILSSAASDLLAVKERDPSNTEILTPFLYFKVFCCASGPAGSPLAVASPARASRPSYPEPHFRGVQRRYSSGGENGQGHHARSRLRPGHR